MHQSSSVMIEGHGMRIGTAVAFLSVVAIAATILPPPVSAAATDIAASTQRLPDDVIAFRTRRDRCDQLRGEEPAAKARAAFLARELDRACNGTDAALARLKRRYAHSRAVTEALAEYDSTVE